MADLGRLGADERPQQALLDVDHVQVLVGREAHLGDQPAGAVHERKPGRQREVPYSERFETKKKKKKE